MYITKWHNCFFSGVGKTTLVQKVLAVLSSTGVRVDGFWTDEVRENGSRVGFDVITVNGERGILARVKYIIFIISVFKTMYLHNFCIL